MTEFLVKHFVKDYEKTEKVSVRTGYGILASMVGIFCNVLLFLMKITIGMMIHSISVIADAFNNLSDAGASIISFIGVKIASKPAEKEHPFGHGRMEYIAALVVAFLVLQVGFTFFKDAVGKIKHPQEIEFNLVSVIVLLLSIGIKLWLGMFNKKLGTRIHSNVMLATAADAMGDVITTLAGKTVEVYNTDAEGRLVLCDGITFAQRMGARTVIDLATLTYSAQSALGDQVVALFVNDREALRIWEEIAEQTGEYYWQLPMGPIYH